MLVAVFILAVVGTAGILALTGATNSRMQSDVRTTAVSLADTVMENIKGDSTTYQFALDQNGNPLPFVDYTSSPGLPAMPTGYQVSTVDNNGALVPGKIYGIPWNLEPTPTQYYNQPIPTSYIDSGVQKVTIIISFNNREIFRLADFKVHR